jgi:malonyl-CoA/methylmalonyl-CoA synthetase
MNARPSSIVEAFVGNAGRTPARLCLRFEGDEWTYGRLHQRAVNFAAALRTWGLQPRDRVALFLENCPDFLAAYLGTHLAGGVVVPVNTQYRKRELRHILGDAGVRLCLADEESRRELERGDLPDLEAVIEAGEELQDFLGDAEPYEPELPDGEDLAVVAYTSGTTGRSKGAVLLHRNLVANAEAVCMAWQWTAEDRLLLTLPLFHTHGLMVGAHGTFFTGGAPSCTAGSTPLRSTTRSFRGGLPCSSACPRCTRDCCGRRRLAPRDRRPCGCTCRAARP